jgi:hypothetical protein
MQIFTVCLQLRPSRYMRGYLLSLHVLLIISAIVFFVPNSSLAIAVILLVNWHWRYVCTKYLAPTADSWVNRIDYNNQLWLLTGPRLQARVWLKQVTVWRWLIVLNFYSEQGACHYPVVLWPDSVDKESLRRFRSFLRHMPVLGKIPSDELSRKLIR